MKKLLLYTLLMALTLSLSSLRAQTDVSLDPEVGGRFSIELNKKISKGLHVYIDEALWFDNNFGSFDRFYTTLGVTYKVLPFLKVGLGYGLINAHSSVDSKFKTPRHRLFLDVTGTYRCGDWQFSLRERVQATHRTDSFNQWQSPRNVWVLKSRLKVVYKAFRRWEPYAAFELRNTLNAPVIKAAYNESFATWVSPTTGLAKNEAGWFLDGFSGTYINRLRGTLGVSYRLDRSNTLEVYFIGDYNIDKEVDANAEGTKLKAYTRETGFNGWLCASYSYVF